MAYDERLATRIRKVLARRKGFSEKRMFGGVAFFLGGNMCCGVGGMGRDEMVLRLGDERAEKALKKRHTKVFDLTGRPMKGFVTVVPAGFKTDAALRGWVREAAAFATSLPPK